MSKTHDDVQWDGWGQVVTIQPEVPQPGHAVWIMHILSQGKRTDCCSIDTYDKNTVVFNNSFIEIVHTSRQNRNNRIIDGIAKIKKVQMKLTLNIVVVKV